MSHRAGRHFLQIPGPSPVPDRVLRAISAQVIDHRGPDFAAVGQAALEGMKWVFKTAQDVVIYPCSGTGAWEAALVNVLAKGDRVLMYETGHFAAMWKKMAEKLGLRPEFIEGDWRGGADPEAIEAHLRRDKAHEIKAVCVVHNETSTGSVSPIAQVRAAIDAAGHPALLMVDTISGLASIDFRFDEWGVDVAVSGSQKGLMLPPGIAFNAVSARAMAVSETGGMPRSYWDWRDMKASNATGYFPYTPATNMLFGLNEAISMLRDEGLENVFARHQRHGAATRAAVRHWGLEVLCRQQGQESGVLTAVMMPQGHSADAFRKVALKHYDISLGNGLSRVADKVFRIGHLGDFNDLTLAGTLTGVELGLRKAGVPHRDGGVEAAMAVLDDLAAPGIAAE
ncbi:MAG: pyridoxal-phosphate-dependent aminotransferase family protein [Paracoccus sp. (in: a-proteobacteria)]|jgi:alanine-glyoxylate transaminase/serine-glyoxylate transaminase/serine-pyruvate transaminase|uniref:pyridoxal-phosphate-dependent aminotransferase family protein n=1 Tax=unclassified Paracoccus (in: a-proteobacteria) TaxID=2688777 RepID=UPI000C57DBB9|nr:MULTISPECIES: aminotransferase class V-fold PLP-dependent enzyme [unclassified Paracoccus (in: a-proteobacteria)]MAN55218.1 serine--glyoxylate aminotransferase [Paracoccus sp. (in: a-proteobacteria)]MBA47906.1 serine--glyoxylate aminotransferase [Paracoccus sp. (in: a-proteobacteria)]|tara:strand:- start:26 stop:1216 length:1191 start_codon:yes stop_codon:yes gene_type:complete